MAKKVEDGKESGVALSKVPPPGCSSEFSTRRERLGGHNCSFFPLQ